MTKFLSALILNAALLLSISTIYNSFFYKAYKAKKISDYLLGIIIGIVGIFLMLNAISISEGVIFDTRSILVSATAVFFGIVPTATSVLIISIYRIIIGGAGAFTGVMVTVMTAVVGVGWKHLRWNKILSKNKLLWREFYILGLITHIVMLLCMLTLPRDIIFITLKKISAPILIIYPLASTLLSMVIIERKGNIQLRINLAESEFRFRTLFEQAPMGIAVANNQRTIFVNLMFEKILERPKQEIIDLGFEKFTHPDDLKIDLDKFKEFKSGKINRYSIIKRYIRPDGSIVWVNMIIAKLNVNNQSEMDHLCIVQDITEMIKSKQSLEKSEAKNKMLYLESQRKQILLISLLDSIPDLIFYKDIKGKYIGCNRAFEKFVGKEENGIIGLTDFDLFDKATADQFRKMDMAMMTQKTQSKNEELVTYPDGSKVYLDTLKTPYYDQKGNVLGMIGVSRDINEQKEKEKKILYLSYHDVLTGLYNRAFFDEEIRRLDVKHQLPLSVIIGDINGLKLINDAFGHAEGDKLLVEIAKILRECCREEDIIARTGGDEFSILLPKTDSHLTSIIFDRIKKTSQEYATKVDKEVYYTSISLGYATKEKPDELFEKVLKVAEENMYRKKLLAHKSLHSVIISSIKTTMFEKSNETEEHAERLADLSRKLGQAIGLNEEELVSLELAATLHDIGKISIDRNILTKRGRLNDDEWVELKKHPEVGYRILQTVPELRNISEYILCHHERWDGKGYPQGLCKENIPLLSRIIAIVDSFDAMTQDRAYRKAMTKEAAIVEIVNNYGTQFDPELAKTFVEKVVGRLEVYNINKL